MQNMSTHSLGYLTQKCQNTFMLFTVKSSTNSDVQRVVELLCTVTSAASAILFNVAMISSHAKYSPLLSILDIIPALYLNFPSSFFLPYDRALSCLLYITFTVYFMFVRLLSKDVLYDWLMCALKCLYRLLYKKGFQTP